MLFAALEDFTGQGEMVCFSREFDRVQQYVQVDEIVLVRGNTEVRGGAVKIVVQDVMPMWKVREQMVRSLILVIDDAVVTEDDILKLRDLCDTYRGHAKLYFDLIDPALPTGRQRIRSRNYVVDPVPEFMAGVARLVGRDNVIVEEA
jgi:DNA polymerase III subunit alpha